MIPDARKHRVRYYGAYSHRRRAITRVANGAAVGADAVGVSAEPRQARAIVERTSRQNAVVVSEMESAYRAAREIGSLPPPW